jgi:hypothetical protein
MQTGHIVALFISERDKLNRAIESLQGPIKRRGHPPKSPSQSLSGGLAFFGLRAYGGPETHSEDSPTNAREGYQ